MSKPLTIALIAGETSGDQLGGWLMAALKAQRPDTRFIGLGGPCMQAQGLISLFPMQSIALMGFFEVLPHIRDIQRRIAQMVAHLEAEQPDVIITIDSAGYNFRVVEALRKRGRITPKYVHYVSPTIWAYKPKRAALVAKLYDHQLCLLPFEPIYYEELDFPATFVGHEIAWWWKTKGDGASFRSRHNIHPEDVLLAVFPGSRHSEITRLWPVFSQAIERLKAQIPNLAIVVQVPTSMLGRMHEETKDWSIPITLMDNVTEKKDLFAASNAALAKSGTIALECALAGVPHVVAYRANRASAMVLRRIIRVAYVHLANLLAGHMVIPELLQENCTPEKISVSLLPLLMDSTVKTEQLDDLVSIAEQLGVNEDRSPSEKAADVILQGL